MYVSDTRYVVRVQIFYVLGTCVCIWGGEDIRGWGDARAWWTRRGLKRSCGDGDGDGDCTRTSIARRTTSVSGRGRSDAWTDVDGTADDGDGWVATVKGLARARVRSRRCGVDAGNARASVVMMTTTTTAAVETAVERKRSLGTRMLREIPREDVCALRDAVAETLEIVDEDTRTWCDDETVERFLRADKGDLKKAKKRLTKTLAWRHEKKPGKSRCAGCFEKSFRSHYMQQIGYDVCGRAVVYSDIGLALDHKASSNVEHCVQVLELLESFLPAYPYDQYVWICDFHKFGAGNMSPSVATKCLSLFARSYPERLEMMVFVEAPKIFNGLYRMLTAFVDPVTVQKLRFIKGPDGKGGGGPLSQTFKEFFSDETADWLVTEMRMHRKMWSVVKSKKSWIKSMILENGVMDEAAAFPEFASHDCRGTREFLNSPAGAYATKFARKHASRSTLVAKTLPEFCAPVDEEEDENDEFTSVAPTPIKSISDAFSFATVHDVLDGEFDRFE